MKLCTESCKSILQVYRDTAYNTCRAELGHFTVLHQIKKKDYKTFLHLKLPQFGLYKVVLQCQENLLTGCPDTSLTHTNIVTHQQGQSVIQTFKIKPNYNNYKTVKKK